MRNFLYLVIVVVTLTMSGCSVVLEDESNCPPPLAHNLVLHFSNTDDAGAEIFSATIDRVEIFLFNESDRLVYRTEATQAEIVASKSASLKVAPGIYRIVCWGNAKNNSMISINNGDHIDNGYIFKQVYAGDVVANGNSIYYAPYDRLTPQTFSVTKSVQKDVDVRFRAAHIKMDFKVIGYTTATGETTMPYIEVTTLYPRYDFLMNYKPTAPLNYIQQTRATTRAGDESYALFNAPRFENDNPIVINLRKDPFSPPIKSLILKDELVAKNIDVSTKVELTLPFEIIFTGNGINVDVTIEINEWRPNPLDPNVN